MESTLEEKEEFQTWVTGKIIMPLKATGMQKGEAGWEVKWLFLGNTHPSGGVPGLQILIWEAVRPRALMRC